MIIDQVSILLNIATTFKVNTFLEKRKLDSEGRIFVEDSKRTGALFSVGKYGVMSDNYKHMFRSGTWLDYIVYEKNINYHEALRFITSHVDLKFVDKHLGLDSVQNELAMYMIGHRLIFEQLLLQQNNLQLSDDAAQIRNYVSQNCQLGYARNVVWVISGLDLNRMNTYVIQFLKPGKNDIVMYNEREMFYCIPYFINQHLLSRIEIYSLKDEMVRRKPIIVFDSNHAFTNLLDVPVYEYNWKLFPSVECLLAVKEQIENHCVHKVASVSIAGDPKARHDLFYKHSAVRYTVDNEQMDEVLQPSAVFDEYKIQDLSRLFEDNANDYDLSTYVKNRFVELVSKDKYLSPALNELLESVKKRDDVMMELLNVAKAKGWGTFVTILQSFFTTEALFSSSKKKIYKTDECYIAVDETSGVRDCITNFRLDVKSKVMFKSTEKTYVYFTLLFKGITYTAIITYEQYMSKKLFFVLRQMVVSQNNVEGAIIDTPQLTTVKYEALFRKVLKEELNKTGTVLGMETLGKGDNGLYITPAITLDTNTANPYTLTKSIMSPLSVNILNCYTLDYKDFKKFEKNTLPAINAVNALFKALVSVYVRNYVLGSVYNIYCKQSDTAKILAFFEYFGQHTPLPDLRKKSNETTELVAYPCVSLTPMEYNSSVVLDDNSAISFCVEENVDEMGVLGKCFFFVLAQIICDLERDNTNATYIRRMVSERTIVQEDYASLVEEGESILKLSYLSA